MKCHCGQVHSVEIDARPFPDKQEALAELARLRGLWDEARETLRPCWELTPLGEAEVFSSRIDVAAETEYTCEAGQPAPESDAMAFLRRRIKLSERLSLIEQAHWQRSRHEDTDSSSAQPHRFGSAC
jgi:hypothetical protein